MMKRMLLFVPLLGSLLLCGCLLVGRRVTGDGHRVKRSLSMHDVHSIQVEGSMNVYLTQGQPASLQEEGDDNILPLLETRFDNGRLFIRFREGYSINTKDPVDVYITAPGIDELHMTGSGTLYTTNLLQNMKSIVMGVTGSGEIKALLNTPQVRAVVSGSGSMTVSGETLHIDLHITGSGNFLGKELKAETVSARITGSGNAHVFASKQLRGHILGSGNLYYGGGASVDSHITGSGSISPE